MKEKELISDAKILAPCLTNYQQILQLEHNTDARLLTAKRRSGLMVRVVLASGANRTATLPSVSCHQMTEKQQQYAGAKEGVNIKQTGTSRGVNIGLKL